jgi:hypothetical protein
MVLCWKIIPALRRYLPVRFERRPACLELAGVTRKSSNLAGLSLFFLTAYDNNALTLLLNLLGEYFAPFPIVRGLPECG